MIKVKLVTVGNIPVNFNKRKMEKWKTKIFEFDGSIENYTLPINSEGSNWEFTDESLRSVITSSNHCDFTLAVVNVPLEYNYYARRIDDNISVITFFEIKEILEEKNIPLENIILNIIYAYCLVYLRYKGKIPIQASTSDFTHDETRGCLFDMTGVKAEIVYSCHDPIICSECLESLKRSGVSIDKLTVIQKEIRMIKKDKFYIIADFIKKHPLISILLSSILAILLGAVGSIIASILYEKYL